MSTWARCLRSTTGARADRFFFTLSPELREQLLQRCQGLQDVARKYASEAVLMALRLAYEPSNLGIVSVE